MSESTNPLLGKLKLPGRTFQLPSRGIFYTNGELDESVKDGEIHVRPMSAFDEICLKNPDQLFSGQAVNEVFHSCIDGVLKPTELLSKDVDALMVFLRTVTYGESFEFTAKHTCKDAHEHSYTANIEQIIHKMKMIDPTTLEEQYTMRLPNDQVVRLRPNRYSQIISIIKDSQNKTELSVEDMKKNLCSMLLGIIISVDGVTDEKFIEEWINSIPAPWANKIADKVESVNAWGPDMSYEINCKDCGEDFKIHIPLNPADFFNE